MRTDEERERVCVCVCVLQCFIPRTGDVSFLLFVYSPARYVGCAYCIATRRDATQLGVSQEKFQRLSGKLTRTAAELAANSPREMDSRRAEKVSDRVNLARFRAHTHTNIFVHISTLDESPTNKVKLLMKLEILANVSHW